MMLERIIGDWKQGKNTIFMNFYDRFNFRIVYEDSGIPKSLTRTFWPFGKQTCESKSEFSIYLSSTRIPLEYINKFQTTDITLFNSHDQGRIPDYNMGILLLDVPNVDKFIINPRTGGQFIVIGKEIFILNENLQNLKKDFRRAIKQLIVYSFEKEGAWLVHSSAIVINEKAVIFAGDKGAGKTTAMVAGMKSGSRFVSNDRVIIEGTKGDCYVNGWPEPIRIVTLGANEKEEIQLLDYFAEREEKIQAERIPLGAVVFPQIEGHNNDVECTELEPQSGKYLLCRHFLTPHDPERPKWLGFEATHTFQSNELDLGCRFFALKCTYEDAMSALNRLKQMM